MGEQQSDVIKFYENKNILITGATGFLGKVLLWKLIKSCANIGKIYLLMRSKSDCIAEKRLIQMLKSKPFSYDHEQCTEMLNKVVAIESDITASELGLSQTDRATLQDRVNIVFHCAASVKFDAPLKENLRDNLYGTQGIVHLCNSIKNLSALVHVSTAYSNCQAKQVAEDLVPMQLEVDKAVQLVESLPDDVCELATDRLLEGRPNTYTYTKALAEHYVAKRTGEYPVSIVRPSIVISAADEPVPGWVDNVNGIGGLSCLASIGMLRTIDWNYFATSDMVPVDYVANCMICAAHQCSVEQSARQKVRVYNMTSGNMNPISWGAFYDKCRASALAKPPNKIVRPMIRSPKYERVNRLEFLATKYLSELLFAHLVDAILALIGHKKIMVKVTRRMHHGYEILKPFTANQWDFESANVIGLSERLNSSDRAEFRFDMREFSWDRQAELTWFGCRHFLLKEEHSEESFKSARRRQNLITAIHYTMVAVFVLSLASVLGYAVAPWLAMSSSLAIGSF